MALERRSRVVRPVSKPLRIACKRASSTGPSEPPLWKARETQSRAGAGTERSSLERGGATYLGMWTRCIPILRSAPLGCASDGTGMSHEGIYQNGAVILAANKVLCRAEDARLG